ncbi:MAG TPA: glycerol kinase GlpK [Gammaproteobacteria bacterium]|jgi:glycerol kinase
MPDRAAVLAIDQGTTSSRAIAFDAAAMPVSAARREFAQVFPADGWVEHDPETIWTTTLDVARQAFEAAEAQGYRVAAVGITNQRETTLVWDRRTGKGIYNAIVWQDRRTAPACAALKAAGLEAELRERTGLLLDPYFSATKLAWLLDHVDGARNRAAMGELAFGTVDSFLVYRLTNGRVHATDATNASRTSLYNLRTRAWDARLLEIFRIPGELLPDIRDCAADYGQTDAAYFGRPVPIFGVAGDQQAATIGQCCFEPGSIKGTYGTGAFIMLNTGGQIVASRHRLLTTVAYQLDGEATYGLEGSIFAAGATVQWLRDGLGIIERAADTEGLARGLTTNAGVYLVPAFTGLGAPYWEPDARAAIFGLTRATGPAELARAALESACYQTRDLLDAMAADGVRPVSLRVDGGMVANDWFIAFLADVLGIPVERPRVMETTALGAAYLAGRKTGIYGSPEEFAALWRGAGRVEPRLSDAQRDALLAAWHAALTRVLD